MDEVEAEEEDFYSVASPLTDNELQDLRPASATLTSISSLADLQPDTVYCNSELVLNGVVNEGRSDAAKVVVPHTLSFKLLHYFGPYDTAEGPLNYLFVASVEDDDSHVVLICHYGDVASGEPSQMDNYLNRIFKVQNFQAISSKNIRFVCDDIDCDISEKSLHDISIVTSKTLNSVLVFKESTGKLTKLNEVVYPSNKAQTFNFVNVIGFVQSSTRNFFIIFDENTNNFRINFGYCQFDQLKQNPHQNDIEKVFFSPSDQSVVYPPLTKGDLVCIRDLCLGFNINVVAHPDKLFVIKPYENYRFVDTFSEDEIDRILELLAESANLKVVDPVSYKIGNYDIIDFCGQVLAKKVKSKFTELFLLLPYKSSRPTYITENTEFIVEYISSSRPKGENIFKQEIINELAKNNQIVVVRLYGNNAESAKLAKIFSLVLLVNVHVKKDNMFLGFNLYIMHEGRDNGKGCFVINNDTILGKQVLNNIDKKMDEFLGQQSENENYMSEEDINQHFDEEVLNRYDGPDNLRNAAESQKKQHSLYNQTFKGIVQANIKDTSLNGPQAIIRCYINEQMSMRVNSFAEMVEKIQRSFDETIVVDQNATSSSDGTLLPQKTFFIISGQMANYIFEDELGLPITDLFAFRKSLIKFYCKNPTCDYKASYLSVAPQISRIIVNGADVSNTTLNCSKCGENSLGLYLTLKFTIEDCLGQKFTCLLTSPEAEEFIGVTSQQLMFASPRSGDICKAVEILLQTLCPYRRPLNSTAEGSVNSSADSIQLPLNPTLEWIIQYVRKVNPNESFSADFLNGHMFDLNATVNGTQIRHFFYIRGISELSLH